MIENKLEIEIELISDRNKNAENVARRDYLRKLDKWSGVILGAVGARNFIESRTAARWINEGDGDGLANPRGGWLNQ